MEVYDYNLNNAPIGVMDSGVGGLTVLKSLLNILPNEDYIYFGDTKNLPYGEKSKTELIKIVKDILDFFEEKKVKAVILACNTTSATAYDELKDKYSFKIYPLIQSVVSQLSKDNDLNNVAVMATLATVNSRTYTKEFAKHRPDVNVIEQACPLWVPIVEKTLVDYDEKSIMNEYLKNVLAFNPQKIILGCTHYPYLLDVLANYADKDLFVNPAPLFANFIKNDLTQLGLLSASKTNNVKYFASENPQAFVKNAQMFLNVTQQPELVIL